jgi:signal transduction histidine kinase
VERDYDPELDLFCFAGEIRQVFANLVGNSIDASVRGGRLRVSARRSHNWKDPEQTGVRFTLADNGAGMEREVLERAFEAFFTTKEVTGTGLGLWISHEIVTKHNGVFRVRSRTSSSGRPSGTIFQFFIPDDPDLATTGEQAAGNAE